jgi:hypothetical protein
VCTMEFLPLLLHPTVTCVAMQNELAILEFIHCFVEVLDKHFGQVCELDIMNEPDMVRTSCQPCAEKPLSPAEYSSMTPVVWKPESLQRPVVLRTCIVHAPAPASLPKQHHHACKTHVNRSPIPHASAPQHPHPQSCITSTA